MDNSQKKFVIITASILLHAMGMFIIFVIYQEPQDLLSNFDPSQAIDITETVFYDPQTERSSLSSQATPDNDWAQLNPRASSLGRSMEMPDGPIGVEMPGDQSEPDSSIDEGDSADQTTQVHIGGNSLEFNPQINFEQGESIITTKADASKAQTGEENKAPSSAKSIKKRARKALAGITQGYLQQLKDEGENLIKTLGGDPNKRPTAEQLKYERYLAKIQWCLQNAHNINQDKCQLHEPIDSMMRIYFVLNKEGKMSGFKIMQSSGKAYVDQYISALFQFASSSFPPLPAYIKEEYLPLTYTVMVNWNTGSSMGFSRY